MEAVLRRRIIRNRRASPLNDEEPVFMLGLDVTATPLPHDGVSFTHFDQIH